MTPNITASTASDKAEFYKDLEGQIQGVVDGQRNWVKQDKKRNWPCPTLFAFHCRSHPSFSRSVIHTNQNHRSQTSPMLPPWSTMDFEPWPTNLSTGQDSIFWTKPPNLSLLTLLQDKERTPWSWVPSKEKSPAPTLLLVVGSVVRLPQRREPCWSRMFTSSQVISLVILLPTLKSSFLWSSMG